MEKLLIIGAGIGQVPLLKKAKERGINVTVASIYGNYPCFELADDVIYEDIYNKDVIVEEAIKRGITAVVSDENDLMMPTVAYVAEKLGIPGNCFDTVISYCNKNNFRQICETAGVPCPKHVAVNSGNYEMSSFGLSYPLMVKPADSQSSIGVKKVQSQNELQAALEVALQKSPTHSAIVEEFFEGREVVCEGFINDGKYYLLQFADRRYFDLKDVLIPSQTIFPSTINDKIKDRIVHYEQELSSLTKPAFAITHSEYLVNESTGDVCIVESALRGGGVYISSDLIPLATGIDITNIFLDKALGIDVDVEEIFNHRDNKAAAYVCFYLPEGIIQSISGMDRLKNFFFVKETYVDKLTVGQQTTLPSYKGARLGPILVKGLNRDDLESNIKRIQETLKITVKQKDGCVKGIFWS